MHLKTYYNINTNSLLIILLHFYCLSGQPSPPAVAVLSDLAAETVYCSEELPEQCVDLSLLGGGGRESAHVIPREIPAPEFFRP